MTPNEFLLVQLDGWAIHAKSNMSIRYDSPVCRLCVGATKSKGEAGVDLRFNAARAERRVKKVLPTFRLNLIHMFHLADCK